MRSSTMVPGKVGQRQPEKRFAIVGRMRFWVLWLRLRVDDLGFRLPTLGLGFNASLVSVWD